MLIKCDLCNKEFNRRPSQFNKRKQHFCSKKCLVSGFAWSEEMRKKQSERLKGLGKGRKVSFEGRRNMALAKKGEKHPLWKGNNVGYKALHQWISDNWGRERFCERCKKKDSKRYEWANVTGIYDRVRKNWKRLCCSCHHKFDKTILNICKN